MKESQLLEQVSEIRSNIARSLSELEMCTEESESTDTSKRRSAINERMASAPSTVEDDALVGFFDHDDPTLRRRVMFRRL